ncbi:hypothetical protein C8T65DRAFT_827087 [Cerioporus squamosus]|nr:hypothetical protein C8T65DRAFT_827087 [Cerioporus squamosus]
MGQDWQFFNVTRRQEMETHGGPNCAFLHRKQGFLVRSITVPFRSPKVDTHWERLSRTPPAINNKGLLSLPDELLLDILDLEEIQWDELVILAVTCRRLFILSLKMLNSGRTQVSAPWADCRIVCAGEYAKLKDLPAALLKAGERAFIEAKIKEDEDLDDDDEASYGGLSRLGCEEGHPFRGAFTYRPEFLQKFKSEADREMFKIVASVTFPPGRTDWVLCNTNKKEYVRASALAELARKPKDAQPFLPHCRLDLGHALLTRICWSIEALPNTPPKMNMHRGPWVGDRFCIITMDRLGGPQPGEESRWEWTDVSKAVVRDLVQVCRVMFGKKWLKQIEGDVLEVDHKEYFWFGSDGEDKVAEAGRAIYSPWTVQLGSAWNYVWA